MLEVNNLCKTYPTFKLKNVSFNIQKGYITGFIGDNGAGKSTTLKCLLNIVHPDGGEVNFLGKSVIGNEVEAKQQIAFMFGAADYYTKSKIKTIAGVYKKFFTEWDENCYRDYCKRFNLDENKRICELSAGMKVKLSMALALSHNAKLLIFDEPTSGLDPIARDELMDIFQSIVEDGERSILFSTHVTSDLDKCADYILFIRNGELIANDTKDDLIAKHAIIEGANDALTDDLKSRMISFKTNRFGFIGLILKEKLNADDNVKTEVPNLEDLMVYYHKEVSND